MNESFMANFSVSTDRILDVTDVQDIMGCSHLTARKMMKESGHCLRCHHRLYIFEADLVEHLRTLEVI